MTDFTDTPSTVIDTDPTPSASGGGTPNLTEPVDTKDDKPLSLREDIEAAFKDGEKPDDTKADDKTKVEDKAPDKDAEDKTKKDAKPDAAKDGETDKAAATDKKDEAATEKEAESEDKAGKSRDENGRFSRKDDGEEKQDGKRYPSAPKSFLPKAQEVWRNVPHAVQTEVERMERDHAAQVERFKTVSDRYDKIRPFDELAQQNGRDLTESLTKLHHIENMMSSNPVAALNAILMEVGPRKADGQPVSLLEVAQFVNSQGPQGYHQLMQQAQQAPRQQQESSEVAQLRQQLAEVQHQQVAATIIEPFRTAHPRYDELQDDIAFFLESGKIPTSLSPVDRLEAAYDMAERINPPSHVEKQPQSNDTGPDPDRRADRDFSGSKSIKSSPGSVTEEVEDQAKGDESVRDSILKEMRRLNRA